jgi:hypothetical protein
MKNIVKLILGFCMISPSLSEIPPRGNPQFSSLNQFIAYCSGFSPNSKHSGSLETADHFVAAFYDSTNRILSMFDLPKPLKLHAWSDRPTETATFFLITAKGRLKIAREPTTQILPLTGEAEIRDAKGQTTWVGFTLGDAFLIPKNPSTELEIHFRYIERKDAVYIIRCKLTE